MPNVETLINTLRQAIGRYAEAWCNAEIAQADYEDQQRLEASLAVADAISRLVGAAQLGAPTCNPAVISNGALWLSCTGDDRADSEDPTPIRPVEPGDRWSEITADVAKHRCGPSESQP